MSIEFQGRVAIVTGAGGGLGKQHALALAKRGAKVLVNDLGGNVHGEGGSVSAAQAVVDEIISAGGEAIANGASVTDYEAVQAMVKQAMDKWGRVDILVNNAGKSPLYDNIANVNEQMWDSVIGLNLKGPFRLSALLGSRMSERAKETGRAGSIINISSIAAIHPTPDVIPYTAAKAGLNAMTIGFAQTFGPHVRVNCIMPGSFRTDISKAWNWDMVDQMMKRVALKRVGEPHEIVGAALFLASDASTYTTGAVFTVDGGVPT